MVDDLNRFFETYLKYFRSKDVSSATPYDKYMGISGALRTKVVENWLATQKRYSKDNVKRIYYISLEYNLNSLIKTHTISSGLEKEFEYLKKYTGLSDEQILAKEPSVELGNGIVGDFAGNILETLASSGIPSVAYGLWYELAQFKQSLRVSGQLEMPYYWSSLHHPWAVDRPEYNNSVFFGGHIVSNVTKPSWVPDDVVTATPIDYPISGYHNGVVNTLRFWSAVPSVEFRPDYSLHNDYVRACDDKADTVKFTRYLFNEESSRQTSEQHIKQQFFLASASIKDIVRRHVSSQKNPIRAICDKAQIILADCRCGLVIVEFIRILVYDYDIPIEEAVEITRKTFVISLPLNDSGEFQKVPLYIFEQFLPLHMKIIMDMNYIILEKARQLYHISNDEAREISLIEEGAIRKVCMANLAILFSGEVCGYSEGNVNHMKNVIYPNITRIFDVNIKPSLSAISIRRWLVYANKPLTDLISSKIGTEWIKDNSKLANFEKFATDISIQNEFEKIKNEAKEKFSRTFNRGYSNDFLPESLFIPHFRKISIANSQLLMLFYIACRYIRLIEGETLVPRVYLFAGRALPSDFYGKQLLSLMSIFLLALRDSPELQVYFLHNRNASLDEKLLTIGDMTEYVSTSLTLEASAFNIYKCAANGVITLAGTNASEFQTAEKLGEKTTFRFGNPDTDVNTYNVDAAIEKTPVLQKAFDLIYRWIKDYSGGEEEERKLYPLLSNLRSRDELKTFMFFDEYCKIQDEIDVAYKNKPEWLAMALRNIARSSVGTLDKTAIALYKGRKKEEK